MERSVPPVVNLHLEEFTGLNGSLTKHISLTLGTQYGDQYDSCICIISLPNEGYRSTILNMHETKGNSLQHWSSMNSRAGYYCALIIHILAIWLQTKGWETACWTYKNSKGLTQCLTGNHLFLLSKVPHIVDQIVREVYCWRWGLVSANFTRFIEHSLTLDNLYIQI